MAKPRVRSQVRTLDQAGIGDSERRPMLSGRPNISDVETGRRTNSFLRQSADGEDGRLSNFTHNRGERLRNSRTSTAKSQADQLCLTFNRETYKLVGMLGGSHAFSVVAQLGSVKL